MSYEEMLKELMTNATSIVQLGRDMQMSPQKMENLLNGTLQWKAHDQKNVKSHYEMKKRVREAAERMKKLG